MFGNRPDPLMGFINKSYDNQEAMLKSDKLTEEEKWEYLQEMTQMRQAGIRAWAEGERRDRRNAIIFFLSLIVGIPLLILILIAISGG